jgi:hypothetical protein
MKIIRKQAKFGSKTNQKFYHERFANYKEFYDCIMSRQSNAHQTIQQVMDDHDSSWVGVRSVEEATNLFLNGWQQNVERMKVAFNKELNALDQGRPVKLVNSVCGFMPIVPNAIMGLPKSMIDVRIVPKKSKILNFMIAIDRACSYSVEEIIKKMSKMLAYIAMLERSGQYRCRIEVFFTAFSGRSRSGTNTSASVLVKSENQLFDIKRVCFPVIHPAMLRLFMFAWEESLPLDYSDYRVSGYGCIFALWGDEYKRDFINVVNENNEKTICLDLRSNIEEVLGKEVK